MKKIFTIAMMMFTAFFLINIEQVNAANATTLKIHYRRHDGNYTDWSLWLWSDGVEGQRHYFDSEDDYGKVATIDVLNDFGDQTQLGVLVSKEDWTKDVSDDRFIDLTKPDSNGVVDVYLLQNETFMSYVSESTSNCNYSTMDPYECAQNLGDVFADAFIYDDYKIHFYANMNISASDLNVYENNVLVSYSGFTVGANGELVIPNINIRNTYTLEYTGGESPVVFTVRPFYNYESQVFANEYHYDGVLGPVYTTQSTTLKVWAPLSSDVEVNLYTAGHTTSIRPDGANNPYSVLDLTYTDQGVWEITLDGDMHGVYYTFNVVNDGVKTYDIQDPYGQTFGLNGARSMIIDMDRVNPEGWDEDSGVDGYTNPNDAIIYELHVRDLTSDSTWNGPSEYRNTYMGLTVDNTSYTNSISNVTVSTGLAHLKELGITHLHLLPTYDQDWNDERNFQFNWGYNPQNYNSPEGGYSTDPYDGTVRVNEYKQMVMALHENGINVINDVVYNHTGPGSYYSFNRIVPGYFYRYNSDGSFLNASGVGNTTASERYMVSKFIVDSVEYWAKEYHIDGFRFDLMRIHDVDTMNALSQKVEEFDQDIFVYGEPWAASDDIGIPYQDQAAKHTLVYMPLVAAFNDNFRNAIKGSPDGDDPGYVTNGYYINDIKNGISGSQNWDFGNYTYQSINYVTAHDNLTLYDKLLKANNTNVYSKSVDYQARLSNSIVMFSQGTPFLHAGVDFLRSKGGNHNSYDAPDSVNQLDYSRKSLYNNSFEYYKGIIEIRKAYDSFKMYDYADINQHLEFFNPSGYGMIGYRLTKNNEDILVYFHGGDAQNIDVSLPSGAWELIVDRDQAGLDLELGTYANTYPIEPYETLVFVKGNNEDVIASPEHEEVLPDEPIITNTINKITVGATFRLNVDRDIVAYQIDNGEYITVDEADFIYISGLEVGTHFIRVKTADGGISTPFALIVEDIEEVTCEDDPTQDKCQTEEPILTCEEDPTQEQCQEEPVIEDTGCFGSISNSLLMISTLSVIGVTGLIVLRKNN